MQAVRTSGRPQRTAAARQDPVGQEAQAGPRPFVWGPAVEPGSVQQLRARALVTSLVLSHRLRARLGPTQQAGLREQAARILGLTARLWLG